MSESMVDIDGDLVLGNENELKDHVIVTYEGNTYRMGLENAGLTIDSSRDEIIERAKAMVSEDLSEDEVASFGSYYTVNKSTDVNSIFVYPKSVAGEKDVNGLIVNDYNQLERLSSERLEEIVESGSHGFENKRNAKEILIKRRITALER